MRTEGTLISLDESDDFAPDAYGVILGVPDFLEKADRLADEWLQGPTSLRKERATKLKQYVVFLRADLQREAPRIEDVIFHAMHAAFWYHGLLEELSTDIPSRKAKLTRLEYLCFRDKAKSRTHLTDLCGLKTVFALTKWEQTHGLPRATYSRRRTATK